MLSQTCFAPRLVSLVAFVVLLHGAPALANPAMGGKGPEEQFNAMDAGKDGKVSSGEFFKTYPQMKEAAFTAIDKDGDGAITLPEWQGFTQGHGADRAQGGMGSGMKGEGGMTGMPPRGEGGMMPPMMMPPASSAPAQSANPGGAGAPAGAPDLIMPSGMGK